MDPEPLWDARDVAGCLKVKLANVRISNALRITPADLEARELAEPPPPTEEPHVEREPGADDGEPSPFEDLTCCAGMIPAQDWLLRKNAAQSGGRLSKDQLEKLKATYTAAYKKPAGGGK